MTTFEDYSQESAITKSQIGSSVLVIPQMNYAFMEHPELGSMDIICNFSSPVRKDAKYLNSYRQ